MKKAAYILGSVEIILGLLLLCINTIIQSVLPVLGRVSFQAAAAGSYSPRDYAVSMPLLTVAAVFLIAVGAAQLVFFVFRKGETE